VRHGDQVEAAVEDAEQLVALEVECVCVVADLGVGCGESESEVTVMLVQAQQMGTDARPVARSERSHWQRRRNRSAAGQAPHPS
jgi:hypothetical protein